MKLCACCNSHKLMRILAHISSQQNDKKIKLTVLYFLLNSKTSDIKPKSFCRTLRCTHTRDNLHMTTSYIE